MTSFVAKFAPRPVTEVSRPRLRRARGAASASRCASSARHAGRTELRVYRDRPDAGPGAELDSKLDRQATPRVAGLPDAAAAFLRGFS